MSPEVRAIYTWMVKLQESPTEIFRNWNKVRAVVNKNHDPIGAVYPGYVRMLMQYRVK